VRDGGIEDEGSDQEVYLATITLYTISPISHTMKILHLDQFVHNESPDNLH
jgi:hypothetical protein